MDRRRFVLSLLYGAATAPLFARAQDTSSVRRIGFLNPGIPDPSDELQTVDALRKVGWVAGQNLVVERRYANNKPELLHPLVEDLIRSKVEVIVTSGTAATLAAKRVTSTVPIVFWSAADPVRTGLVESLARPNGNVTGFSVVITELEAKRVTLLRELVPAVQRIGRIENRANPYFRATRKEYERVCRSLGMEPIFVEVATAGDLANAVAELARRGGQSLSLGPDPLFYDNRVELMREAQRHSLFTTVSRDFIREAGALISYDSVESEENERGAAIVDKILRGARPAEIPVEQPTKFELILNLKTARALRVLVPPLLRSRASEVIE
jgi:ABC-type uncharacterized transport system substrate-binding protein